MSQDHHIGQRISYDGAPCTVRYVGEIAGTAGSWLGVEWDDAARGKHDGSHKGTRYFTCSSSLSFPFACQLRELTQSNCRPVKVTHCGFIHSAKPPG